MFENVSWMFLAVTVWVIVTRLLVRPRISRPRHIYQRRDALLVFSLDTIVSWLCGALMTGFALAVGSGGDYPVASDPSPEYLAGFFSSLAAAGFREEIFLLALPVLLLRSAGRGWGEIVTVLAVLRLSFHVYYGVPVLGLLPWAVLAVLFFRYTQSVWPLVFSHSILDLLNGAGLFGGDLGVLAVTVYGLAVAGLFVYLVDRKTPVRAELGLEESPLTRETAPV